MEAASTTCHSMAIPCCAEPCCVSQTITDVTFSNTSGYVNEKADALFAEARAADEPAARKAAFAAVPPILVNEAQRSG